VKKTHELFIPVLLVVLCFTVLPALYGQTYRTFRSEYLTVEENTRWQIGPFRLSPTITLRDIGYDNNVFRQRETDDPISDFTAIIAPRIDVNVLYRNWLIITMPINPSYVYYSTQKHQGGWNFSTNPRIILNIIRRFVLSGEYFFRKARRRSSSEFDVRAYEQRSQFTGSFFYETSRETAFGLTGSIQGIRYEDVEVPGSNNYVSRELDRTETNATAEFYYKVFRDSDFFITGGFTDFKFKNFSAKWRNSQSYQIYTGIRWPILGTIRGSFSLGLKRLNPQAVFLRRFFGLVGNANLEARINRINFRLVYDKDVEFSYWSENAFFVFSRYGAGLSFYITQFLRIDYNYAYTQSNYPEDIVKRLPDESYTTYKRQDITNSHSLGAVVRLVRNVGIGVTLTSWERDSNDERWGNRKQFFIGGYLTYDF
jgi:hypothetical protein